MPAANSADDFDLILRQARVIDVSQNLNQVLDVGVRDGKIAAMDESLPASQSAVEKNLQGKYLCPGLIDLHGHWYGGSTFGIDPDYCLNSGVTTAVDAGTTGFLNFDEFRRGPRFLRFSISPRSAFPRRLSGNSKTCDTRDPKKPAP